MPGACLLAHLLPCRVETIRRPDAGPDRNPARRRRPQVGHVEVGVQHLPERPRDRCRGHEQHVRADVATRFRLELTALLDAESMLLVDDREPQARECDRLAQQRVRADDHRCLPRGDEVVRVRPVAGVERSGEQQHAHAGALEQRPDRVAVLPREQIGRCQQRTLEAGPGSRCEGIRRHRRLARADIALEEPEHRGRTPEVARVSRRSRRPGPAVSSTGQPDSRRQRVDERRCGSHGRSPSSIAMVGAIGRVRVRGAARPSRAAGPAARRRPAAGAPRPGRSNDSG